MAQVDYNPEINSTLDLSVVETFQGPNFVACVKFSRDGQYFAVLQRDETHIYDVAMMSKTVLVDHGTLVIYSEAAAAEPKHGSRLCTVRFSPNGKCIATGAWGGQIKIWEIKHKRVRAILKGHTSDASCIDFSPDGRSLASASWDQTVRIWCIRDGSSQWLSHVGRAFDSVAFSPDGRYVVAGNDDGHLRIWGARTRQLLRKWAGHEDFVMSVAFQPDGLGMASGSNDHTWKSWNLSSLQFEDLPSDSEAVFTCSGHTDAVLSISFSYDGRWVVTSSCDGWSRIWDAATGVWVCRLKGHTEYVRGADFSPAGCYLVTGSLDGQVILWRYREVGQGQADKYLIPHRDQTNTQ